MGGLGSRYVGLEFVWPGKALQKQHRIVYPSQDPESPKSNGESGLQGLGFRVGESKKKQEPNRHPANWKHNPR